MHLQTYIKAIKSSYITNNEQMVGPDCKGHFYSLLFLALSLQKFAIMLECANVQKMVNEKPNAKRNFIV